MFKSLKGMLASNHDWPRSAMQKLSMPL